jgi:signal transduction histidine kinase
MPASTALSWIKSIAAPIAILSAFFALALLLLELVSAYAAIEKTRGRLLLFREGAYRLEADTYRVAAGGVVPEEEMRLRQQVSSLTAEFEEFAMSDRIRRLTHVLPQLAMEFDALDHAWSELHATLYPGVGSTDPVIGSSIPIPPVLEALDNLQARLGSASDRFLEFSDRQSASLRLLTLLFEGVFLFAAGGSFFYARELRSRSRSLQTIRLLNSRLVESQELERRRIAMELHDETAQRLSTIKLLVDKRTNDQESEQVSSLLSEAISQVRNLSYLLRPPELESGDLSDAIAELISETRERVSLEVEADTAFADSCFPDPSAQLHVYRIIQEALHNVERHAEASRVQVTVCRDGKVLLISIRDNGRGLRGRSAGRKHGGGRRLGHDTIRERARMLGGAAYFRENPTGGTEVRVIVPAREAGK